MIGEDAVGGVPGPGVQAMCIEVFLRTRHEEGARLIEDAEPAEIQIGAVHEVDRAGLRDEVVEHVDIMELAVRDVDKARDRAAKVQKGVHFHGPLGGAETGPREDRQAQIDSGGVESVDRLAQHRGQSAVTGVKLARLNDQALREVGVDAPVAALVGVGQGRAPDWRAEADLVKLAGLRRQTGLDVTQALAVGELGERHGSVLLRAPQGPHMMVAAVALDDPVERRPRQEIHGLSEEGLPRHARSPEVKRRPCIMRSCSARWPRARARPGRRKIDTTRFSA